MSAILRQADQGYVSDYFALLQEIASRESLVQGLLSVRIAALSQRPVVVEPAKGRHVDPVQAKEHAAFAQEVLDGIRLARPEKDVYSYYGGLASVVEQFTLAAFYGVRVPWFHWDVPVGMSRPRPVAIEFLDERRLWHDIQTDALYLATQQDSTRGLCLSDVDPALCFVARNQRISNQLAMAGAARACLLPWWIRFGSYKDFATYLETWAKPSLIAKSSKDVAASYDTEAVATIENLLEDWMGDTRSLLPEGFDVEVIEAVLGGEKVFESADKMTERHLQFALVGSVGAIAGDATTYANGGQAQSVRDDLTDSDALFAAEQLERMLAPALAVEYGPGHPSPKVTFALEDSVDALKARALAISSAAYPMTSMLKAGIWLDIKKFCEDFKMPLRADGKMDPDWLRAIREVANVSATPTGPAPATLPENVERPPAEVQASQFARASSGLMIALYPSADVQAALALPGGEPAEEIHLTLCYLGKAATYPYLQKLTEIVKAWASQQTAMVGETQGLGIWGKPGEFVLWASPDVAGLSAARADLVQRLSRAGILGAQEHDFTPHFTLAYLEQLPAELPEVPTLPLFFDRVCLVVADQQTWLPFRT